MSKAETTTMDPLAGIYQAFASHCRPYRGTGPWAGVATSPGALTGPGSLAAAVDSFSREFPAADLVASGLFCQDDDAGRLVMRPELAADEATLLAIHPPGKNQISDIVTASGCCRENLWPIFPLLGDAHSQAALQRAPVLVLTNDLADSILLRGLGFAAAPVAGLQDLNASNLRKFAAAVGICLSNDELRDTSDSYDPLRDGSSAELELSGLTNYGGRLSCESAKDYRSGAQYTIGPALDVTIARCSLASDFGPPAAVVDSVVNLLADLPNFCELNVDRFRVWAPAATSVEHVRFLRDKKSLGWLKTAFVESLNDDSRPLEFVGGLRNAQHAKPDWSSAIERLNQVYRRPADDPSGQLRTAAERTVRKIFHEQIGEPLLSRIPATADPVEKFFLFEFANLLELWAEQALRVRQNLYQPCQIDEHATGESIRRLLQIGHLLSTKSKVLTSCTTNPSNYSPPLLTQPPPLAAGQRSVSSA